MAENANLRKDVDDYRFVMDGEVAKWKNTTNELKKKVRINGYFEFTPCTTVYQLSVFLSRLAC